MVFFNYATMQMAAKIVYYGPGLCGKTTNLHHIYAKTSPQSRGEMVSLETETDRTLFFDLLPIDVGVIGGFKTRLQLYTIPGQVFYNTTRKLVLKGVDGIVFVADSQKAMLDANVESFKNLRENLAEIGLELDDIPLVVQVNKRDLPNIADVNTILDTLDPERKYEHSEAIAAKGDGVFETLKQISKLTLRTLRRRMTGEEPVKPTSPATPPRRPIGEMSTFRVQDNSSSPRTIAGSTPIPHVASSPSFTTPAATATTATATVDLTAIVPPPPQIEEIEEVPAADEILTPPTTFDEVDSSIIADAPIEEPPPFPAAAVAEFVVEPQPPPPPPPAPIPEPEIDFSQTEKPAKSPEVKHVKVRSSVDIMAELEGLRKRATQSTPKAPKKEAVAADIVIETPKPKRDVVKTLHVPAAPGVMPQTRTLRVSVSFENEDGVVQKQEQFVELDDASDIQSVTLNIRIDS
jgi:signal recognition particle receptor subunit beta